MIAAQQVKTLFAVVVVAFIVATLLTGEVSAKKAKNEKECEVCKKVIDRVITQANNEYIDLTDQEAIQQLIKKCYYVGGTDDAATGLLREVTGPISRYMPADVVCNKLKKLDSQICDIIYYEEIDLSKIDLNKQRVKVLKKILQEHFGDSCKGCLEKTDYIKRIEELKHQRSDL
eukprot:gene9151-1448_t